MKKGVYRINLIIALLTVLTILFFDAGTALGRASVVSGCWNGNPNYPFWPRMEENDMELMQDITFVDLAGTKRQGNRIYARILSVGPHRDLPGRRKAQDDMIVYEIEVFEERSPDRVAHYASQEAWEEGKPDGVFNPRGEYGSLLSILQQDYLMVSGTSR